MGLKKAHVLARVASGSTRNLPGRKSTFKPEYCEQVIEWGKAGKSRAWMTAQIGITHETLYQWIYRSPEFAAAMDLAKLHEQAWWEDQGQDGLLKKEFNGSVWAKNMGSRFKRDWCDTQKVEHDATGNFVDLLKEINGSSCSLVAKE